MAPGVANGFSGDDGSMTLFVLVVAWIVVFALCIFLDCRHKPRKISDSCHGVPTSAIFLLELCSTASYWAFCRHHGWPFWAGLNLGGVLLGWIFEWMRNWEIEQEKAKEEGTAELDWRHAILVLGVCSILWDSAAEWQNPSPELGYHYQVPEESLTIFNDPDSDWRERAQRVYSLFWDRIEVGLRLMCSFLLVLAELLKFSQLLFFFSFLLVLSIAGFLDLLLCSAFLGCTTLYLGLKVELPHYFRRRNVRQQQQEHLRCLPEGCLRAIIRCVPPEGFPTRAPVEFGMASKAMDERFLLACAAGTVQWLQRLTRALTMLDHIVRRVAGGSCASRSGNTAAKPKMTWAVNPTLLMWLPIALPRDAIHSSWLLPFLLVAPLKHFVLTLFAPIVEVAPWLLSSRGAALVENVHLMPLATIHWALARRFMRYWVCGVIWGLNSAVVGLRKWQELLLSRPL